MLIETHYNCVYIKQWWKKYLFYTVNIFQHNFQFSKIQHYFIYIYIYIYIYVYIIFQDVAVLVQM